MDLTNLGLMLARAIAVVRRDIGPPTKPVGVKKAIATRTRRNGLSESAEKGAEIAKAKEKAKVKERAKLMETEIGKVMPWREVTVRKSQQGQWLLQVWRQLSLLA